MNNERKKILTVEADKIHRLLMEHALQQEDWDLQQESSGKVAKSIIQRDLPHLVLLDLKLPDMKGITLLKEIREEFRREELPVIVVSGDADQAAIVEAIECGANDYITKPFVEQVLKARVHATITAHLEQHERLKKERTDAMLASLGAACHHMAQPLTAAMAELEILSRECGHLPQYDQDKINEILHQVKEAGDVLRQLQFVEEYRTVDYTDNIKLLDITAD